MCGAVRLVLASVLLLAQPGRPSSLPLVGVSPLRPTYCSAFFENSEPYYVAVEVNGRSALCTCVQDSCCRWGRVGRGAGRRNAHAGQATLDPRGGHWVVWRKRDEGTVVCVVPRADRRRLYRLLLDTGSSNLDIASSHCTSCDLTPLLPTVGLAVARRVRGGRRRSIGRPRR